MVNLFKQSSFNSQLYNDRTFYSQFVKDLIASKKEVIIESPYITATRLEILTPILENLLRKGVKIHVLTKDPGEHDDEYLCHQATNGILDLMDRGVHIVLVKNNHHRKIAIIDKSILYEGSLNILSQARSQEIMRRVENKKLAMEMFNFLGLKKIL